MDHVVKAVREPSPQSTSYSDSTSALDPKLTEVVVRLGAQQSFVA
jgi:hypothetical protein